MPIAENHIKIGQNIDFETGEKLEPEQVTVEPTVVGAAPAMGNITGNLGGSMVSEIAYQESAGQLAQNIATRCELCSHWDHEGFVVEKAKMNKSLDSRKELVDLRLNVAGMLFDLSADDHTRLASGRILPQIESFINEFGICRARSELFKSTEGPDYLEFHHPRGGCPEDVNLFKAKSLQSERQGAIGYDAILKAAQNR